MADSKKLKAYHTADILFHNTLYMKQFGCLREVVFFSRLITNELPSAFDRVVIKDKALTKLQSH